MCGLAGVLARPGEEVPEAVLDALARALAHRGPDGQGRFRNGPLAMVHLRLAIIDLVTGDQPLSGPGGTTLIANAEIYNHVEWRRVLAETRFATHSDCEVPLHLFARDGEDFTRGLRGMYAIALWDAPNERLYLARDPFGIKPLYVAETEMGLAFASEAQALVAAGLVEPGINDAALGELLQMQFTTGRRTIFSNIERVLPGETLVVEQGRIVKRLRRPALPDQDRADWDETEALERLDAALIDSVRVHERADVPYGLFLSGGVDSSTVLAAMARVDDRPVRAYTVGFDVAGTPDERGHAAAVAKAAGADHVDVSFGEQDFWSLLPQAVGAMDDPAADYAILPTYHLARRAAEDVKVVLSGEGGDELFAGYGRYRRMLRPRLMGGGRLRRGGTFDGLDVLLRPPAGWRLGMEAAETAFRTPTRSPLQVAQAMDIADWLPNDLLTKLDRCLMAHGVEGRVPLLDNHVADIAWRLPDAMKLRNRQGKWLLRRWLDRELPVADAFSHKRGFTVPVGAWIARRGTEIGRLVAAHPAIAEICEPSRAVRLFERADRKREGFAAWTLLFYALWYARHMDGLATQGMSVEAVLRA
jgi:asparagine synthase (glutamine-hydrolysing)